jgi:hypothetical protein
MIIWKNGGAPFNLLVDLSKLGANFNLKGVGVIGDDKDGFFVLFGYLFISSAIFFLIHTLVRHG